MTTVLLLEGERANGSPFTPHLAERYTLLIAHTGKAALALAKETAPDVLVLDAASMRTSGDRICLILRTALEEIPIIHIKDGPPEEETASVASTLLYLPFTYRKLCNRIERYVKQDRGEVLERGPIRLNLQQGILTSPIGETKLTPKLVRLLEELMRNPNQIVDRRTLMNKVWQTDYMGDTRTLDVHIRWVRQAVERNPNKPEYIKTVRGKGYRFNLNEDWDGSGQ